LKDKLVDFFISGRKARTVAGVDFETEGKW